MLRRRLPTPVRRPSLPPGCRIILLWNEGVRAPEKSPASLPPSTSTTPHFPAAIHASPPKSPLCSQEKVRTPQIFRYCFRPPKNPGHRGIIKHPRHYLSCLCIYGGWSHTNRDFAKGAGYSLASRAVCERRHVASVVRETGHLACEEQ